jgi:hypothetical protein
MESGGVTAVVTGTLAQDAGRERAARRLAAETAVERRNSLRDFDFMTILPRRFFEAESHAPRLKRASVFSRTYV